MLSGFHLNVSCVHTVYVYICIIEILTLLSCNTENGESIQILHYENGQKYEPHFDYFHDKVNQELGGHRVATVLMYLSDVEKGGETIFPNSEVINNCMINPFLLCWWLWCSIFFFPSFNGKPAGKKISAKGWWLVRLC